MPKTPCCMTRPKLVAPPGSSGLTLSRLGKRLVSVLESSAHKSAYSCPINMISSEKWICYVLPIHVACSIMQTGPLVPKLQQVTGLLCGR